MHQSITSASESASPSGRRLSRSFHSCLRGADHDDIESGRGIIIKIIFNCIIFTVGSRKEII